MENEKTHLYHVENFDDQLVKTILDDVYYALEERGYHPINQLVGYIISGDPGYISSHLEARKKICSVDRTKILEVLLRDYLNQK